MKVCNSKRRPLFSAAQVLTESTEALYPAPRPLKSLRTPQVLTDKVHQLGLFWK